MIAHEHRTHVEGCHRCELGRDEAASALAEDMFPGRYIGDLTGKEWERVYETLDAAAPASRDDAEAKP